MNSFTPWTKEQINIGLAKRAWSYYDIHSSIRDTSTCYEPMFELCADDFYWYHEGPQDPRVPTYPGELRGKQALIDMLTWENDIVDELDLIDPINRPMEFFAEGDRVVVLIAEKYRIKKTGRIAANDPAAVVMDFRDNLITQMRIIANLSDYIEAQIGAGWSIPRI